MLMKKNMKVILFYLLVMILLVVELFPIMLIILTSFKDRMDIWTAETPFQAFTPTLDNYREILIRRPFLNRLKNSAIVALFTTFFSVGMGTMASYGFSRFTFKGNRFMSLMILASRMVPPITLAVPFFLLMMNIGLLDTYASLIIAHTSFNLPFVIWLTLPFFKSIPKSYEDAALIDGCNRLQTFVRIFLPLVKPGLVVAGIFSFIFSWNDFLYALILASSDLRTAPVAVSGFMGQYGPQWGPMTAGGTIILLPVLVFVLILQRHIIHGLAFGGID